MARQLLVIAALALLVATAYGTIGRRPATHGKASSRPRWFDLGPEYSYERYLTDFDKHRLRASDHVRRRALFDAELKSVLAHNADPRHTFKRGVNQFSDWTSEEKNSMLMQSVNAATELEVAADTVTDLRVSGASGRESFDWRDASPAVLTAVKDQGYCGSCWAHGTVEAIESQYALNTGDLLVFSQQQFISCAPNVTAQFGNVTGVMGGCNGYFPNLAIDFVMGAEFGGTLSEEWENPYRDYYAQLTNTSTAYPCEAWMKTAPRTSVKVTGKQWLKSNNGSEFEHALINKGPVIIVMAVYNDFLSYESGLYSSTACEGKNGSMPPSHVVNLVGFGYDKERQQHYWTLRNSWSSFWGEAGFVRMLRTDPEPCGTMAMPQNFNNITQPWVYSPSCGMCGILTYGLLPQISGL